MSAPDFTARALALKALESAALSAYEVAVANGFEGDEADWLASLAGPEGPAGPQGDEGPQGPAGSDGAQGPPGADGADGAAGADGSDGQDGEDGFGAGLGDPGADRLLGWDESAGAGGGAAFFAPGNGLSIAGTSLDVAGWTLLDSETGVSGVNEVAFTGIPGWANDLLLVATGITVGESNNASVEIHDGSSWSSVAVFGANLSSGANRRMHVEVRGRHLDGATAFGAAGTGPTSSPSIVAGSGTTPLHWRCDGGIDGIGARVSNDFDAGDFFLYGRA